MKNVTPTSSVTCLAAANWNRVVRFHGHSCPGLAMGARMVLAAAQALDLDTAFLTADWLEDFSIPSPDEELVCVAETDACGVDAVQLLLGCTIGKGNLLIKYRGKSAMTFYSRASGRAARIVWTAFGERGANKSLSREERIRYFLYGPSDELFVVQKVNGDPPGRAVTASSIVCAVCGEWTAETSICLLQGRSYCLDCFPVPGKNL